MVEIIWLLLILAMPLWAFLCAYIASSQGRYVAGWAVAGLFLNVWASSFDRLRTNGVGPV